MKDKIMLRQIRSIGTKITAVALALMMLASCDYVDFASDKFGSETGYALLFLADGSYMAPVTSDGNLQTPIGTPGSINAVDVTRGWTPRSFPGLRKFGVFAASSTYIYIADYSSNSVAIWDFMNGRFLPAIPVGFRPRGIAVSPDGNTIVVANSGSATISIIDANSLQVTATISL